MTAHAQWYQTGGGWICVCVTHTHMCACLVVFCPLLFFL